MMMSSFEFATANRVVFGAGKLNELAEQVRGRVKRLLLVRGHSSDAVKRVSGMLSEQGIQFTDFQVRGEPTVRVVREGVRIAGDFDCDTVVGLGGGSVLDAGKAIAALATNSGDVLDYLEVVGKGQALVNAPLRYIAIPTTAGTGSEVTRNAVIEASEQEVKVSLRSPMMLPWLALVDPELTYDLPPHITASTGLDALTQLIEPFVSVRANPMTDAICRAGMRHVAMSLRRAFENGTDKAAREGISLASLFGGMALANAGLGAVHGFAGPLGGMYHAPHGALCARLLPLVMETNIRAMQARQPGHPALERYLEIAQILTGDRNANVFDGVGWVSYLVRTLQIPALSAYGMEAGEISDAVEKTLRSSSYKGNPISLSEEELRGILERAL
ncbi:MAG: iron-containing alcohol dehydrogenase [Chloroflexota bacterium]